MPLDQRRERSLVMAGDDPLEKSAFFQPKNRTVLKEPVEFPGVSMVARHIVPLFARPRQVIASYLLHEVRYGARWATHFCGFHARAGS